jgi:hypothetical protein
MDEESEALRQEIRRLRKTLAELTPDIEALLMRRGFRVYKKEPGEDLLIPGDRFIDRYYEMLKRYSFRLFLRDVIKHQEKFTEKEVTRYATAEVTKDYIEYLLEIGLLEGAGGRAFRLSERPIKSFGETLEWFIAQIFIREFSTEAIWGVKFKRPSVGGDYDLIAKINGSLLYMEVKSSPPKQIYANEITAFLDGHRTQYEGQDSADVRGGAKAEVRLPPGSQEDAKGALSDIAQNFYNKLKGEHNR